VKFRSSDKSQFRSTEIRSSDHFPYVEKAFKNVLNLKQKFDLKNLSMGVSTVSRLTFENRLECPSS
jgi:hypothetical protein